MTYHNIRKLIVDENEPMEDGGDHATVEQARAEDRDWDQRMTLRPTILAALTAGTVWPPVAID